MELEKYKAIVFDLGGTLMENEGMPLDWSDYYYQGFKKINDNLGLELSDADIDKSAEILKSYNPRNIMFIILRSGLKLKMLYLLMR